MNPYSERPVFAGFLIDASGSMQKYAQDVIAGHQLMLNTLRLSQKCHKGVLYVYQCLFADHSTVLNAFYPLDRNGKDQVVTLNSANYVPSGMTALCASIVTLVQELEVHLAQVEQAGFLPASRIAVITDGGETMGGNFAEVAAAIKGLRDKEWLESSVVIGLKNPDFDDAKLEQLRVALGFSQKVGLDREPQAIRRAFILASQLAVQ